MNDKEIISEINPGEVSIVDIFHHIKTASHEDWMLFYCKDVAGVLRTVDVSWGGDGWDVDAYSVENPLRWSDGNQVFSRNPFDTLSQTLNPSDTLTLAIKTVKEAGYTVVKII